MTILAGVCAGGGAICFFSALGQAPVTVVVPIAFAAPLVTLTGSAIFLRRLERINRLVIGGTLSAVCGVALVVLGGN
jgi:drug/metabolite transporter (DMT)-like permease